MLDVTDPTNIHAEGKVSTLRNIWDIDTHQIGTNIYALIAANRDNAIQIINITNPASPAVVATVRDSGNTKLGAPRDVSAIQIGDYHYAMVASTGEHGFEWINITNATNPTSIFTGSDSDGPRGNALFRDGTSYPYLNNAISIIFHQNGANLYAYVAGSQGVQVVDITNASNPRPAGVWGGFGNEPNAIALHQVGSKVYTIASVGF